MNKKILIISQHFYPEIGSAGNRMKNMYQLLIKKGYEVTLITTEPSYPNKNLYKDPLFWDNDELNKQTKNVHRVKNSNRKYSTSLFNRLLFFLEVACKLLFKVFSDKKKYDFILVSSPPIFIGIVGVIAKYRYRCKLILEVRDLWPESLKGVGVFDSPIILKVFGAIETLLYKKANTILVNSKGFIDYIHKKAKVPLSNIHYLPNSAREYEIDVPKNDTDGFKVIYTGNIGLAQDIDFLKQLAKKLNGEQFTLTIIGYGMKSVELKQYIKEEKLKSVTICSPLSRADCLKIIRDHQVGIVSLNDKEVFDTVLPGKVVDYMTCKIPIVGAVSGYSKEIIEKNNVGFVSGSRDVDEIYQYIEYLYEQPDKRKEMAGNAEKCIKEHFLWEKNIDVLDNIFKLNAI